MNWRRYVDAELLSRLAGRRVQPRGLVSGIQAGSHASALAGYAIEFSGHREYVRGDDPKHIDWRLYYTRDRLFIKQYQAETNFVCHFVIDVSASMGYGEGPQQKFAYAARLAATLAYSVLRRQDKPSLTLCDDEHLDFVPPSDSPAQLAKFADALDRVELSGNTALAERLSHWCGRTRRREIVIVLSDFFMDLDHLTEAFNRLRFQRLEVVLFHILHHDESHFDFSGTTRFTALEGSEQVVTDPIGLRREYLAALQRFRRRLGDLASNAGLDLVSFNTSFNPGEALAAYLGRGSVG